MANRDYDPVTSGALALVRQRLRSGRGPAPDTRPGDTAGSPDPLDQWLTEAVHGADIGSRTDSARPGIVVVGLVREAEHALRRGDVERARRLLGRSLDLAAPERLRRPFLQAPAPVQHLLRGGTALAVRHPWLRATQRDLALRADAVVAPAAPEAPAPAAFGGDGTAVVVEPLTAKEQEVLGHLAELLTTEEIAEAMFVSVNTVRTHVRGVLRKLAVTRRHEAVRRAWRLGLLQRSSVD
jgi:DNA-binding CsgD family transcriptional regulator